VRSLISVWTNERVTAGGLVSEYAPPTCTPLTPAIEQSTRSAKLPTALLGVPFDNLTISEALDRIDNMVASGDPHYVVTANVDFCVQSFEDVELRRILVEAHLTLCDGTPLLWASRLFGNPLPERVAGADLVPMLIKRASEKGHRIFFLGGAPEVTRQAVQRLERLHPQVVIAGHYSPPFRPLLDMNHDEIVERIRAARPDLLFVSFGCPKAEKWMAMHYRRLGVPVSIGVGATIDFLAGNVRRAPDWMQRGGLEWLFRMAQEPRRLCSRYVNDLRKIGWPLLSQLYLQCAASPGHRTVSRAAITDSGPTWVRVQVPQRLNHASLLKDASVWDEVQSKHCLIDLSDVAFIDSTGLAALLRLRRRLAPWSLVLLAPSAKVLRVLRRFQLEDFFHIAPTILEAREFIAPPEPVSSSPFANPVPPLLWTGEVTAANAEDVWISTRAKIDLLHAAGEMHPSIDLSELRFIDSTGVGLMLRTKRYAQNLGVHLQFTNPRDAVRNVLRMARLELFLLHQ
jgi:N-acetylglucosaminyldiphosphoundecaprenol N-acetyl-beta-D-mannosaminyltransferase